MLKSITLCGVDTNSAAHLLFPKFQGCSPSFIEWGVVLSSTREGGLDALYPPKEDVLELGNTFQRMSRELRPGLLLDVRGLLTVNELLRKSGLVYNAALCYDRIKVELAEDSYSLDRLISFVQSLGHKKVVLPAKALHFPDHKHLLELKNVEFVIDSFTTADALMTSLPSELIERGFGYGLELDPSALKRHLAALERKISAPFWIEVQNAIRDKNNLFSTSLAWQYIEAAWRNRLIEAGESAQVSLDSQEIQKP